jgi:2,5-furandicarboxylate decarboxylase 1
MTITDYLDNLKKHYPEEVVTIDDEINPASFEATAILRHLELAGKYPLVYFTHPLNLKGEVSKVPLVTNVFASRQRCALALGLHPEQSKLPLALEYGQREASPLPAKIVSKNEAPVKEVVKRADEIDLREFPIVKHHEMDLGPYIDMTPIMCDPQSGAYNAAFLRTMYKAPRQLALYMSPRHNWEIVRRNEEHDRPTPVVIVVSHHPAFFLGTLNNAAFEVNDYEVIGAIMGQNLRVTSSETWGEDFLVPADADIVVEGEVMPGLREIEAPFGEWTGYYGPQRLSWVIEVKAITHQGNPIFQDVFVGHTDNRILGTIPKEGSIYNRIKGFTPNIKGVHLPLSGAGRLSCYISIDKKAPGESKQAALIALSTNVFIKHVVVVDADIDPYNEEEVLWAVATRVQADRDIDLLREIPSTNLDPSMTGEAISTKVIIDATKPVDRPFSWKLEVPSEAMMRVQQLLKKSALL